MMGQERGKPRLYPNEPTVTYDLVLHFLTPDT